MMTRALGIPVKVRPAALHGALAVLLAGSTAAAPAAVIDWVGGDGAWETGSNWSAGSAPGAGDYTRIEHTGAVTSSADGNSALEFENRSQFTLTAGSLSVVGTLDTQGVVQLNAGTILSLGRLIVQATGSLATSGAGSEVSVVEGIFSYGDFDLADSVQVTAESLDNFATMSLSGGATVVANSMINHAEAIILAVSDPGSALTIHGNLTNAGTVAVQSGGALDTDSLDNTGLIEVTTGGRYATGSLGNDGEVVVTGDGSGLEASGLVTNRSSIDIGGGAAATLAAVVNTGTVAVGASSVDGDAFDNQAGGTLQAQEGAALTLTATMQNAGAVEIAVDAALRAAAYLQSTGHTLMDGGTLAAGPLFNVDIAGGLLRGHGLLDGNLRIGPDGEISPGSASAPTGTFEVEGTLALQGLYSVDLAGIGDHDLLDVAGSAALGGTLAVSLVGGFLPSLGDFFDIVLANAITGDFFALQLPTLANGLELSSRLGPGFYRLEVIAAAPVPLPGPLALLAASLLTLLPLRRHA